MNSAVWGWIDEAGLDQIRSYLCYLLSIDEALFEPIPIDYLELRIADAQYRSSPVRIGPTYRGFSRLLGEDFIIAGGYALQETANLKGIKIVPDSEGIDIFSIGGSLHQLIKRLKRRIRKQANCEIHYWYTGQRLIVWAEQSNGPGYHACLTRYVSLHECLMQIDLDCCRFAITSEGLFAMPSAIWALENMSLSIGDRDVSDLRVVKYTERGLE